MAERDRLLARIALTRCVTGIGNQFDQGAAEGTQGDDSDNDAGAR